LVLSRHFSNTPFDPIHRIAVILMSQDVKDRRKLELQQAAAYLEDAFHGRLKNGLGSTFYAPKHIRIAFSMHARYSHL
jgi:hypothetical protein